MLKLSHLATTITVGLIISTGESVGAMIANGSFETSGGWETTGATIIQQDESFGSSPTDGAYQALLETLQGTTNASGSQLETFLGLSAGSLTGDGVNEGSAIKQTVTANAGDVLTFSWNFLTNTPSSASNNDFAFFTVVSSSTLADTYSPLLSTSYPTPFEQATGYQTQTYTISNPGTYTLGFGVVDVGSNSGNSGLLIDNASIVPVPFEFSPGLGLLLLGAWGATTQLKSRLLKNCVKVKSDMNSL